MIATFSWIKLSLEGYIKIPTKQLFHFDCYCNRCKKGSFFCYLCYGCHFRIHFRLFDYGKISIEMLMLIPPKISIKSITRKITIVDVIIERIPSRNCVETYVIVIIIKINKIYEKYSSLWDSFIFKSTLINLLEWWCH